MRFIEEGSFAEADPLVFGGLCHQLIGIAEYVKKPPIARNLPGTLTLPLLGGFGCRIRLLAYLAMFWQNQCPKNRTFSDSLRVACFKICPFLARNFLLAWTGA